MTRSISPVLLDTIGAGRQHVLTFSQPIAATVVTPTLVRLGSASPTP